MRDAIVEGAKARFRPIFLTSLTTFLGVAPLILEQARFLIPMAASLGFGIVAATGVLMVIVPALAAVGGGGGMGGAAGGRGADSCTLSEAPRPGCIAARTSLVVSEFQCNPNVTSGFGRAAQASRGRHDWIRRRLAPSGLPHRSPNRISLNGEYIGYTGRRLRERAAAAHGESGQRGLEGDRRDRLASRSPSELLFPSSLPSATEGCLEPALANGMWKPPGESKARHESARRAWRCGR